jgi:ATP phosphoribosyltransferase regulatory subunit
VGFIKGLLAKSGLSPQGQKRAEQAAARKDLPRLEDILAGERIPKSTARAVREVLELTGQEEVLDRGRELAAGDPTLVAPIERLAQLYQLLCGEGHRDLLLLDLGEFRGFDYYDGIVFDVFAPGVGAELGGGGRYDHLIGRFGKELPSTGFALDVDRLFRAVEFPQEGTDGTRIDYLVAGSRRSMKRAIEIAGKLRRGPRRVVQHLVKGKEESLASNAVDAGVAQGANTVVVVGVPGLDQEHVALFEGLRAQEHKGRTGRAGRPPMKKVAVTDLTAQTTRSRRRAKGTS